jgi:heptosyltransferase-1
MRGPHILVVRLGAMGDVIHALPAVASLKVSFAGSFLTWVIDPKWAPLLAGNPFVDRVLPFNRRSRASIRQVWRLLRSERFDIAVDFQGLIKSALVAKVAQPPRLYGFDAGFVRERPAALLYSHRVAPASRHVVDCNLELARAAGASAVLCEFPLPCGKPEGALPPKPFVLACPLAGWRSKQWPPQYYRELGALLARNGLALVVNGPESARPELEKIGAHVHTSGLEGLIDATRRAAAVVGVDSGPLHLAAALGKSGVAIFGPTDPARNGPYGDSIRVLRATGAPTTYKRGDDIAPSMRAIRPADVYASLALSLSRRLGEPME